jgi:hypothetical protein
MSRIHVGLMIAGVTLSLATAASQSATGVAVPVGQAPAELSETIKRGDRVLGSLQYALTQELSRELVRGGPAHAISVCHLEAAAAAQKVARAEGIASGRTSHLLRSPINTPRPWAAPVVAQFAGKPAAGVETYVVDLGNRVGMLRPIPHRAECSGCHGPEERLGQAIRQELKERYPADKATGFKEGDLRGWFWVEVPKS